jgi:SAM-dependent methyltransferase
MERIEVKQMLRGASEAMDVSYPMADYVAAWKVYRSRSDEDERIANHVSAIINSRDRAALRILDVGPGDGRVLLRLLIHLSSRPREVVCVEPNPEFAEETRRRLNFYEFSDHTDIREETLGRFPSIGRKFDVVTCTHSLYFLSDGEVETLAEYARQGALVVVVVDHQDSLFSRLWQVTAPDYHETVRRHREAIRALDKSGVCVRETFITAELADPSFLRPEMRDLVLSLLCYTDISEAPDDVRDEALGIISRSLIDGRLTCLSSCIELTKRGR